MARNRSALVQTKGKEAIPSVVCILWFIVCFVSVVCVYGQESPGRISLLQFVNKIVPLKIFNHLMNYQWILRLQGLWITRVVSKFNFQCITFTKTGLRDGISYKTKNAGKGQEKFVTKRLSSKISGDPIFFGNNYWLMKPWTPRALDY